MHLLAVRLVCDHADKIALVAGHIVGRLVEEIVELRRLRSYCGRDDERRRQAERANSPPRRTQGTRRKNPTECYLLSSASSVVEIFQHEPMIVLPDERVVKLESTP